MKHKLKIFLKRQIGVSLVESILVIVIFGMIILLMANLPNAMGLITKSKHLSLAREIATKQIEDKKATNYSNLVPDTTAITSSSDSRIGLLPSGAGQVKVEDCDASICTNSEDIKQVTVTVNWKDGGKQQSVSIKTFIGKGGLNQ